MIKHIPFLFLAACGIENGFEDVEPVSYDYELPAIPDQTYPANDNEQTTESTTIVPEPLGCENALANSNSDTLEAAEHEIYPIKIQGDCPSNPYPTFEILTPETVALDPGEAAVLEFAVTAGDCFDFIMQLVSFATCAGDMEQDVWLTEVQDLSTAHHVALQDITYGYGLDNFDFSQLEGENSALGSVMFSSFVYESWNMELCGDDCPQLIKAGETRIFRYTFAGLEQASSGTEFYIDPGTVHWLDPEVEAWTNYSRLNGYVGYYVN